MMTFDEAKAALCDPELVAIRDKYFERMEAVFDHGCDDREKGFVLYGTQVGIDVVPGDDYMAKMEAALIELAEQADDLRDPEVFRPLIFSIMAYGVHFIDRLFGMDGYTQYLDNEVGELPIPDLDNEPSWAYVKEATQAFLDLNLTVPVFVGVCLSSPLNQAMNLYSEKFLMAMIDNPDAARRDLRVMTDVIKTMQKWYIDTVPSWQLQGAAATVRAQPPGYGHIDGCSTHIISAEMYREFIADLDNEILSLFPKGGMIHLCGNHVRHIPTWAKMPALKSVQMSSVANEEVEEQVQGLRPDQVVYLGPTSVLPLEKIMDATGGYRIILAENIEAPLRRPPKMAPDRAKG